MLASKRSRSILVERSSTGTPVFARPSHKQGAARLSADWPEITNGYRRRSLKRMVSAVKPSFNIEDVHRRVLDQLIDEFELNALTGDDREGTWRQWHALDAWPDFPTALMRLKTKYLVVSFTILSTRWLSTCRAAMGLPGTASCRVR